MGQPLTSLEIVKAVIGINDESQDIVVGYYVSAAIAALKHYTHRFLEQQTIVEYPKGSIQPNMVLRQRPLNVFTYTGTLTSGSATITNLSSTANLVVGMPCTIGASWSGQTPLLTQSTILSITTSPNTVTLTNPSGNVPVTASGTNVQLVFGIAVWIDTQGNFGFGVGNSPGGPYAAPTELRCGRSFSPKLDGQDQLGHSGMLVRLGGGPILGSGPGSGFWGDGGWSMTGGARSTLTAGRAPCWPQGVFGETKVLYTNGYPTIPAELQQCATEFAVLLYTNTPFGGRLPASESYEGYSYNLLATGQSPELGSLRSKLTTYIEVSVG